MRRHTFTIAAPDFIQCAVQGFLFRAVVIDTPPIRFFKTTDTHTQQSDRGVGMRLQPLLQQ